MSEWKEYKFTEVATLTNGRAYLQPELQSAGKYKIVRVGNLSGGDKWFYSDMELPVDKYCNKGDLLYAWACSFGPYIWEGDKTIYHYHIWKVDVNSDVSDKFFLYYYLKYYTPKWMGLTNGSVMMHITKGSLEKQIIHLPPLETQKNIASILSVLDDKIAVNRRICENLEAQAQALFKHWFIDFVPFLDKPSGKAERKNGQFVESELGMIPLSEVCEQITDGVHNSVKDEPYSNYMLLSCKNIVGGVLSKNNYRSISKSTFESLRMRTKLAKGDILLSSVGTIGEIAIVEEDPINYEFQRSVAIVKPKNNIGTYFLYNALLASKARLQHAAHGAVQQCLFIGDLKKFEVTCCDTEKASRYNETVRPLFEEIAKLHQESTRLSTLRDTLLPKLMSGQIKVNEINI